MAVRRQQGSAENESAWRGVPLRFWARGVAAGHGTRGVRYRRPGGRAEGAGGSTRAGAPALAAAPLLRPAGLALDTAAYTIAAIFLVVGGADLASWRLAKAEQRWATRLAEGG